MVAKIDPLLENHMIPQAMNQLQDAVARRQVKILDEMLRLQKLYGALADVSTESYAVSDKACAERLFKRFRDLHL